MPEEPTPEIRFQTTLEAPFQIPMVDDAYQTEPKLFFSKNDKGDTLWTKFISLYLAMAIEFLDGPFFALSPDSDIYRYEHNKGYWVRDGTQTIQESAQRYLESHTTTHRVNETINTIRRRHYIDPGLANSNPRGLENIVVSNGVLNLRTHTLGSFDPELYVINAFDITFDPEAECPTILKFLEEITTDRQDLTTLQEWFGYHLWRKYFIHKALMLIGEGSNGKTTLLNLLIAFVGEENCSYVELHELSADRFAAADLFGKLANIADDISIGEIKFTGKFKKLTGESGIRTQFKNQTSFNFRNIAKASFSANQLPATTDLTYAFFRRWIILKFTKTFENDNCDKNLSSKLTTPEELSGLLSWALKGLERLLTNYGFSLSTSAKETQAEWKIQSNPLAFFIHVHIKTNLEAHTPKWDIYNSYVPFCVDNGFKPLGYPIFCQRLKETITGLKDSRPRIDGKQVRCWQGIELKELDEETPLIHPNGEGSEDDPPPTLPQTELPFFEPVETPPTTPESSDLEENLMEGGKQKVDQVDHDGPLDRVAQNDKNSERGEEDEEEEEEGSNELPEDYPTDLSQPRPDTADLLRRSRTASDAREKEEET